jgi:hypothetical protein
VAGDIERIVAIDPGDGMGWALALSTPQSDSVYDAGTLTPGEMFARLETWVMAPMFEGEEPVDTVVLEDWRLREPEKWRGSDMPTSQQLGALKYIVARHSSAKIVLLDPFVKKPALGRCKANGIAPIKPDGYSAEKLEHCKDAQLLAWAYLWKGT